MMSRAHKRERKGKGAIYMCPQGFLSNIGSRHGREVQRMYREAEQMSRGRCRGSVGLLLAGLLVGGFPWPVSGAEPEWGSFYSGTTGYVDGIWGSGPNDIFAVGQNGVILHYGGTGSPWEGQDSNTTAWLTDVWGSGPDDVFAVGHERTILHYDGMGWSVQIEDSNVSDAIYSVWGSDPNHVFAVGHGGWVLHYDRQTSTWVRQVPDPTTKVLQSVCGSGPNDVWAVGFDGAILHYAGPATSWEEQATVTTENLYGVWVAGPNEAFAVGNAGTILHYDGSAWQQQDPNTDEQLTWVWGTAVNNVFAVGRHGTIVHYDGYVWMEMEGGVTDLLLGIWGFENDVFAVGSGDILHFRGCCLTATVLRNARLGEVTIDPNQRWFEPNDTASLTATAKPGKGWAGWAGDVPEGHEFDNPLEVVVGSRTDITTEFECSSGIAPFIPAMLAALGLLAVARRRR